MVSVVAIVGLFWVESIVSAGCPPRPEAGVTGRAAAVAAAIAVPTPAEIAKIKVAFPAHVWDNSSATRDKAKAWAAALSPQGAW